MHKISPFWISGWNPEEYPLSPGVALTAYISHDKVPGEEAFQVISLKDHFEAIADYRSLIEQARVHSTAIEEMVRRSNEMMEQIQKNIITP